MKLLSASTFIFILFQAAAGTAFAQGLVPCSGLDCELCSVGALIQRIITFLLLVSGPLAAILFAYAGFLYFTSAGDSGKLEKGKKIFIDVIFGLVIALCAWLVVNTVLYALIDKSKYPSSTWFTLQCVGYEARRPTIEGNSLGITTGSPAPGSGATVELTRPRASGPQPETVTMPLPPGPYEPRPPYASPEEDVEASLAESERREEATNLCGGEARKEFINGTGRYCCVRESRNGIPLCQK